MGELATREETAPAVVQDYGTGLLGIIERASRDPGTDIDKLERLLGMHERVMAKEAEQAFNAAMNKAQTQMPQIERDGRNETTRSNYARLETVSATMRPYIASNGFSLSSGTEQSPMEGHYRITCKVSHAAGHSRDYSIDIPMDNEGMKGTKNKTDTHGAVSAISYGRRVLKLMIFDVATRDDDGNGASGIHPVSVDQFDALKRRIIEVEADEEKFCTVMGVAELKDITSARFAEAMQKLDAKARQAAKAVQ